jgi:hypothetical protein
MKDIPYTRVARLAFSDRCAAFALVKRGFPPYIIAKVFGVTKPVIYLLASASMDASRYTSVLKEYYRLGEEEFVERYVTDDIVNRLQRWRSEKPDDSDIERRLLGPDPASDKYAGLYHVALPNGDPIDFRVYWNGEDEDEHGWLFAIHPLVGAETGKRFPHTEIIFKRSGQARNSALKWLAIDPKNCPNPSPDPYADSHTGKWTVRKTIDEAGGYEITGYEPSRDHKKST